MRIGGVDPSKLPNEHILVLPRGEQDSIVFRARGIPNMEEFDALVPYPKPPGKLTKDGWVPMDDDPNYRETLKHYANRKYAYLVIRSLEPTEIEWDTVKLEHPGTWINWESDLKKNGFVPAECNLIFNLCLQANALDETKIEKARQVFLRGLQNKSDTTPSQPIGPGSTESGEPVNG